MSVLCDYCHRSMFDRRSDWCPMLQDKYWNKIALPEEVLHLSCAEELLGHKITNDMITHCPFNAVGAFPHRMSLGIPWDQYDERELELASHMSLPLLLHLHPEYVGKKVKFVPDNVEVS